MDAALYQPVAGREREDLSLFQYHVAGKRDRKWWQVWIPRNVVVGEMLAKDRQRAIDALRARDDVTIYDVIRADRASAVFWRFWRPRISNELLLDMIGLYSMYHVDGRLPEPVALRYMANDFKVHGQVAHVLLTMAHLIERSQIGSFGAACKLFPDIFPPHVAAVIAAGADKGILAQCTGEIEEQLNQREQWKSQQRQVLVQIRNIALPLVVLILAVIFVAVPASSQSNTPTSSTTPGSSASASQFPLLLTLIVNGIRFVTSPWAFAAFGLAVVVTVGVLLWYVQTARGRRWWDGMRLRAGRYGLATALMEQAQVFQVYGRLDAANVESHEAWTYAAAATDNLVYREAFQEVRDRTGVALWQALRDAGIDQRAVRVIRAAEQAGGRAVPDRFMRIAQAFRRKANELMRTFVYDIASMASAITAVTIIIAMVFVALLMAAHFMSFF